MTYFKSRNKPYADETKLNGSNKNPISDTQPEGSLSLIVKGFLGHCLQDIVIEWVFLRESYHGGDAKIHVHIVPTLGIQPGL